MTEIENLLRRRDEDQSKRDNANHEKAKAKAQEVTEAPYTPTGHISHARCVWLSTAWRESLCESRIDESPVAPDTCRYKRSVEREGIHQISTPATQVRFGHRTWARD
jgi:hypothetical protein